MGPLHPPLLRSVWLLMCAGVQVLSRVTADVSLLGNVGPVALWEEGGQPDGCGMRPIGDQAECFMRVKVPPRATPPPRTRFR